MDASTKREVAAKVVAAFDGHGQLAKALGYEDRRNVWPWSSGTREFPPEHCVTIEQSKGIKRWVLRPTDWHRIWPELIGTEGAPATPQPTTEPAQAGA